MGAWMAEFVRLQGLWGGRTLPNLASGSPAPLLPFRRLRTVAPVGLEGRMGLLDVGRDRPGAIPAAGDDEEAAGMKQAEPLLERGRFLHGLKCALPDQQPRPLPRAGGVADGRSEAKSRMDTGDLAVSRPGRRPKRGHGGVWAGR